MRKFVSIWLFLSSPVYVSIQAQTILYRYNEQGSCVSRTYVDNTQKARKLQKQHDDTEQVRVTVVPPNVFEDQIVISAKGDTFNCSLSYIMANASGQIVHQGSLGNKGITLTTSSLPMGIYILRISGNNYEQSYKLLKK